MKTSLHTLCQRIFCQWLDDDVAPDAPIEGITPEFATRMAVQPDLFSFDDLIQPTPESGWQWVAVEFDQVFDGQFFFYLPAGWSRQDALGTRVIVGEAERDRQLAYPILKSLWADQMRTVFERDHVLGFAYYPLFRPHYHQWVMVIATEAEDTMTDPLTVYAVFSAGDWVVVVEATAATAMELRDQLVAGINSNPWQGWLQAAKAQQQ